MTTGAPPADPAALCALFAEAPVPMLRAELDGIPAGTVVAANLAAATLLGRAPESLRGASVDDLVSTGRAGVASVTRLSGVADHHGRPTALVVLADPAPPGAGSPEGPGAGREAAAGTGHARRDPLTGLGDRAALLQRLAALGTEADGPHVAVMFADLDGFKSVNDTGGHELGDQVLVAVARRLRSAIRPGDTLARIGGDEFVLVCPRLARPRDARAVAERVRATLDEPVAIGGRSLRLTMSLGIAAADPGRADPHALLRQADMAMYRAKAAGGDTLRFHSARMDADRAAELAASERIEAALRVVLAEAPGDGGLVLRIAAVPEPATGRTRHLEASAALRLADGSVVDPGQCLRVAQRSGLAPALAGWVLRGALAHRAALPAGERDVPVCITPGAWLLAPGPLDELLRVVGAHGAAPGDVLVSLAARSPRTGPAG